VWNLAKQKNDSLNNIKESKMKKSKCILMFSMVILSLTFLGSSCETSDPVVGSEVGVTEITHVSFTITDLETSSSSLIASGTVKNIGSTKITPIWYIEGQFYADSTFTLKLGGDNTQITVPLESGVQTLWSLTFSDPNIAEGDYPNFRVSNLRAYYSE
jgi:hypothetical protein